MDWGFNVKQLFVSQNHFDRISSWMYSTEQTNRQKQILKLSVISHGHTINKKKEIKKSDIYTLHKK